MSNRNLVLPGKTIGILGSGQLGRMLTMVAHRLGYRVTVYSPYRNTPAGELANHEYCSSYTDEKALSTFAKSVDVITLEFENIPIASVQFLEQYKPVFPQSHILAITQNRIKEKCFVNELGIKTVRFAPVYTVDDLVPAIEHIRFPLVLKTAEFGYDGRGQKLVADLNSLREAYNTFAAMGHKTCIAEEWVNLEKELSVIVARQQSGEIALYPIAENRHENHILSLTKVPAQLSDEMTRQVNRIATTLSHALNLEGLLCVEFFVTQLGELMLNEIAPRPHNSGHYTIEATACSQFEQQLRAVCGLPLGETTLLQPGVAMVNLLGNLWQAGSQPNWRNCFSQPNTFLHLYGKTEPRENRKMGHITTFAESPQAAEQLALSVRNLL
jgi:5-(carboxyamino)imidazole ribonucleotide synthase